MGVYDGNVLPESPTSAFQMAVCMMYTLLVCVLLSLGAFAVLAAQYPLDAELPPIEYMQALVRKHNGIIHGMLAFVPATYSLVHLYTSSLHNGSLYSASNIFYAAFFAFATKYLGWAVLQLLENENHMDTNKAVYETLYMLSRAYAKLFHPVPAGTAWSAQRTWYDCFFAVGAQDDQRLGAIFRIDKLFCRPALSHTQAHWLFRQGSSTRHFTGSLVVGHGIRDKVSIASFISPDLYSTAKSYLTTLDTRFKAALTNLMRHLPAGLSFVCKIGDLVNAKDVVGCLLHIDFHNQGLNMAVERYICRATPAVAARCVPIRDVQPVIQTWFGKLYDYSTAARLTAALAGHLGFYCWLWLAYMHMVLLGVDLLKMHNNKSVFSDHKAHPAGFFEILDSRKIDEVASALAAAPDAATATALAGCQWRSTEVSQCPAGGTTVKVAADVRAEQLAHADLYSIIDEDLHNLAAMLATMLVAEQMLFPLTFNQPLVAGLQVNAPADNPDLHDPEEPSLPRYLQSRTQLVMSNSSVPAVVKGVKCMSAGDWVQEVQGWVALEVFVVAAGAVVLATISCSNGVLLAVIAGLLQSLAAFTMVLLLRRMPRRQDLPQLPLPPVVVVVPLDHQGGDEEQGIDKQPLKIGRPVSDLIVDAKVRALYKASVKMTMYSWLHLALALAGVAFVICLGLAITKEPFYAGQGMCVGRCINKTDCWNNITLGLPGFDGSNGEAHCPGEGMMVAEKLKQQLSAGECPAFQQVKPPPRSDDGTQLPPGYGVRVYTAQTVGLMPGGAKAKTVVASSHAKAGQQGSSSNRSQLPPENGYSTEHVHTAKTVELTAGGGANAKTEHVHTAKTVELTAGGGANAKTEHVHTAKTVELTAGG